MHIQLRQSHLFLINSLALNTCGIDCVNTMYIVFLV